MIINQNFDWTSFGPMESLSDPDLTKTDLTTIKYLRTHNIIITEVRTIKGIYDPWEETFKYVFCYDQIPINREYTDPDDPTVTWIFLPFSSIFYKSFVNKWFKENKTLIKDLI